MSQSKSHAAKPKAAKPESIPDSLRHFDALPDAAHVRAPVVAALLGVGVATIWRWSENGRIPGPKRLGPRVSGWNVGELRAARKQAA